MTYLQSGPGSLARIFVLLAFVAAGIFTHVRGRVRHTIGRQLTDHSTFMAPYNALMYLFSAVPSRPFIDLRHFPELEALRRAGYEGWLRNVAVALGNAPADARVVAALTARADDPSPIVREHVRWALERQRTSAPRR